MTQISVPSNKNSRRPRRHSTIPREDKSTHQKTLQEKKLASQFLINSAKNGFGKLIEDIEKNYMLGHNNYPNTVAQKYSMLVNFISHKRNLGVSMGEVFISDTGKPRTNKDEQYFSKVKCFKCNKMVQFERDCPKEKTIKKEKEKGRGKED